MTEATKLGFETLALHGGQEPDPTTNARAVPIYQTTSYVFNDTDHAANLFGLQGIRQYLHPDHEPDDRCAREADRRARRRRRRARVRLRAGGGDAGDPQHRQRRRRDRLDHQPLRRHLQPLPLHAAEAGHQRQLRRAERRTRSPRRSPTRPRRSISETIGNPDLLTLDIEAVAEVAHAAGVPLILDNTLPTPYLVRPIEHGADIVVHSATKFIGGHGTSIGGIVVDGGKFDWTASGRFPDFTEPDPSYHGLVYTDVFTEANFGANIAFIIKLRVQLLRDIGAGDEPVQRLAVPAGSGDAAAADGAAQPERAGGRPLPDRASEGLVGQLPGLCRRTRPIETAAQVPPQRPASARSSGSASRAAREAGEAFIDNLKLFSHLANVGDAKSLVIHPASTTHSQLTEEEQATTGVTPDYVRLSSASKRSATSSPTWIRRWRPSSPWTACP